MDQGPPLASPGVAPGDPVLAALAVIESALDGIERVNLWGASDGEARDRVELGMRVEARLGAVLSRLVGDLDTRDDAVAGARKGQGAKAFLREVCRVSGRRAAADVKVARLFADSDLLAERIETGAVPVDVSDDPAQAGSLLETIDALQEAELGPAAGLSGLAGLPRLGLAFREGLVTREHVDVAVRAVHQVPQGLLDGVDPETGRSGWERADVLLTDHARRFDPSTSSQLARELLERLDPDGSRSFDPESYRRRWLSITALPDGMMQLRGQFDAASMAAIIPALEQFSARRPDHLMIGEDGEELPIVDLRTPGERTADALVTVCTLALSHPETGTRGGEPPHVTVHVSMEELQALRDSDPAHRCERSMPAGHSPQVGAVGPALLAHLSCGAIIETVVHDTTTGAVLDLGRSSRVPNAAIRRALAARDGGCVCCGAPVHRAEAHHVDWWSRGGRTAVETMTLLCEGCHTQVHLGIYDIEMREGVPWIRPPDWIDRQRRWRRAKVSIVDQARQESRQLAFDLLRGACPDAGQHAHDEDDAGPADAAA